MDFMSMLGFKKDLITLMIDEAIGYIERGEYDEAVVVLKDKALSREPEHRRANLHLAVCYMLQERFDEAEAILLPMSKQKPMDSETAAAGIALDKVRSDRAKKEAADQQADSQ